MFRYLCGLGGATAAAATAVYKMKAQADEMSIEEYVEHARACAESRAAPLNVFAWPWHTRLLC